MAYDIIPPALVGAEQASSATGSVGLSATGGWAPAVGNLLVVVVYTDNPAITPAFTAPPGWILEGQAVGQAGGGMAVWSKIATAAETTGSLVFTGPSPLTINAVEYSGASGLDGPPLFGTGGASPATTPSVTAGTAADIHLVAAGTSSFSPQQVYSGGSTRLAYVRTNDGSYAGFGLALATYLPAEQGNVGPTGTHQLTGVASWLTVSLLIAPPIVPDPPAVGGAAGYTPGVTFTPGEFQPTPVFTINGHDIANNPVLGLPVALDGFTVRWGHDRLLNQPEPATATVEVFYWSRLAAAEWASGDALVGRPARLAYEGVLPGDTTPTRTVFFKGRVRQTTVRRRIVRASNGTEIEGAVVTVDMSSVETDLSNVTPDASWPQETLAARRARIQSLAGSVQIDVRSFWETPHVEAVDSESQATLYEHTVSLYDAAGDRLSFRPATTGTDRIAPVLRRDYSGLRGLVGLVTDTGGDGSGRDGKGAYLRPLAAYPANADPDDPLAPTYIYAPALEYDLDGDGISIGPEQRITRVVVTNPDGETATLQMPDQTRAARAIRDRLAAGGELSTEWTWTGCPSYVTDYAGELLGLYGGDPLDDAAAASWLNGYIATHPAVQSYTDRTQTLLVAGTNELIDGVRSATLRTPVVWNAWADMTAADLTAMVAQEGTQWAFAPVRLVTRLSGGFETVAQARLLLAGAETQDLVFLQRSVLPGYGIRPLFGISGGQIGYADRGWELELNLAPVAPPDTPQHAISWDEIDDGTTAHRLEWHDEAHAKGLHESVTWGDIGYCARGLGMTSIPADNGWDE